MDMIVTTDGSHKLTFLHQTVRKDGALNRGKEWILKPSIIDWGLIVQKVGAICPGLFVRAVNWSIPPNQGPSSGAPIFCDGAMMKDFWERSEAVSLSQVSKMLRQLTAQISAHYCSFKVRNAHNYTSFLNGPRTTYCISLQWIFNETFEHVAGDSLDDLTRMVPACGIRDSKQVNTLYFIISLISVVSWLIRN